MYKFKMSCPGLFIGKMTHRPIKDGIGAQIGERTFIDLEYRGGFVQVEVDKGFAEKLIPDSEGTATIELIPSMSGKSVTTAKGNFAFIETGFSDAVLTGFEPTNAKVK